MRLERLNAFKKGLRDVALDDIVLLLQRVTRLDQTNIAFFNIKKPCWPDS